MRNFAIVLFALAMLALSSMACNDYCGSPGDAMGIACTIDKAGK